MLINILFATPPVAYNECVNSSFPSPSHLMFPLLVWKSDVYPMLPTSAHRCSPSSHVSISLSMVAFVAMSFALRVIILNGCKRSRVPAIARYLVPIPDFIPGFVFENVGFARSYLLVAFEAEGCVIVDLKKSKKYIKLSRYVDVTKFIKQNIPLQKRFYKSQLPVKLVKKIESLPPPLLLGEYYLLKNVFDINCTLKFEAIRHNKVSNRAGKISARWVLYIYNNNVRMFIEKIGFISENKKKKSFEALTINDGGEKFSVFFIMKKISLEGYFSRKIFVEKMISKGYISPGCFIYRYEKKGLIRRVSRGNYKIISQQV